MTTTSNPKDNPWAPPPDLAAHMAGGSRTLIRGTCYFVSGAAAIRYYVNAHNVPLHEAIDMVGQRLQSGEIKIGTPIVNGEFVSYKKLIKLDGGTRWGIIE